jgi:hypothetical protein
MNSLKELFDGWDWEQAWAALLLIVAICGGILILVVSTANHRPRFYYVEQADTKTPCVRAWQEWSSNAVVYCSDDINKNLDVMARMNQSMRAK